MTAPISSSQAPLPAAFPFAALVGQPELSRALLLTAVEPALGGVLIEGPRGTAKSTAARALAPLLPGAPFVTLPLGASLEHLVGTLDIGQALAGHELRFAPGLLARAHGGVLYVDEVNLLPDALVDTLLDAAASGVNVVERDGISHRHAARFVLVGTMNPEEGSLRPQLQDRFGLCVRLSNLHDASTRQAAVAARLAFDADPDGYAAAHAPAQARLAAQLAQARARLAAPGALPWSDAVHAEVTQRCLQAGVDGLRADLVMLRAARALAAWEGAADVDVAHVARVAPLVLAHRGREGDEGDVVPTQSPRAAAVPSAPSEPSELTERPSAPAGTASGQPGAAAMQGAGTGADADRGAGASAGGSAHGAAGADADAGAGAGSPSRPSQPSSPVAPTPAADDPWGALAPQPVGLTRVKPLRPLASAPGADRTKKA